MPRRRRPVDEDAVPVMVPRQVRPMAPVTADRVRRLREHLVTALGEARGVTPAADPPQATGFAAEVAATACGLCQGWCCRNGGDDAYLDDQTMARARRDNPALDAAGVVQRYLDLVPELACQGSCIFHGREGCTLARPLRADICNSYFCGGLTAYLRGPREECPTVVIAGEGEAMRTSTVPARTG